MSTDEYDALIDRAIGGLEPTTARLYSREAHRFGGWCRATGIDPLRPSGEELERYLAGFAGSPNRIAKVRSALRAVIRVAGIPHDEHGLRTGDRTCLVETVDAGTARVIDRVVVASPVGRRAVIRSGLAKLVTWAIECEVDLLAVAPADLDDYRRWLTRVGNPKHGELMVIARRFLAIAQDPSVRTVIQRRSRVGGNLEG